MVVKVIDFSRASSSPLNPLSARVREYIYDELQDGLRNNNVTSVVLTGGLQNFSAGADLTEFGSLIAASDLATTTRTTGPSRQPPPQQPRHLTLIDVVQALENSTKPIVAAIVGACLGGGLELALACHYRVAVDSPTTKLGLPEVHVGVIPGAGGTQRLPKLVGLATACQLILTGSSLSAKEARLQTLVDDTVDHPQQLLDKAKEWALFTELLPLADRRLGQQSLKEAPAVAHNVLQQAALSLPRYGIGGYQAALRALRASYLPLEQGMIVERDAFMETLVSEEGQTRRYAFFAVRQAQKLVYPSLAKSLLQERGHPLLLPKPKAVVVAAGQDDSVETVVVVAVVGAGTMGTGIAMVLLQAGFRVILVDVQEKALQNGLSMIQQTYESQVRRKRIQAKVAESMLQRLSSTTRLQDLGSTNKNNNCQLVVEAIVENMRIKQSVFRTLDQCTPPSCILLSNTSTLDIDAMASVLRPERQPWFMGWHFFSPANIMKLVEIVKGSQTSPEAITLLQLLSKKIGKIGVVVGNCDGFCGNRLLRPYSLESVYLLEEGVATIAQVDEALVQFGFALGPFQMGDLAGNDVGYNIRKERGWVSDDETASPSTNPAVVVVVPANRPARYSPVADVMVRDHGRIGQKAGKGWYDYDKTIGNGRTPLPSQEMEMLLQSHASKPPPREGDKNVLPASEIVRRCLYPLVNEGFKCLEEGISLRPSDIDVVYLHGYGWPAWRGGPMYWADHQVGLPNLLAWLQQMSRDFPTTDHFVPSRLLIECVQKGITVEELYRQKATTASTTNGYHSKL
ncbi:hypothetical protein ACA910_017087 [Epithemia clementina (nom. ined.)]